MSSRPEGLTEWQRVFRNQVVEAYRELPADGPNLNEMVSFAESVAAEVGPQLREHGYSEGDLSAEAYAAFRTCALFALANQFAGLQHAAWAEGREPDTARLQVLFGEFHTPPFDQLLHEPMLRHVGIFSGEVQERALHSILRRTPPSK